MEVVMGALPGVINKLGDLLVGEFSLRKAEKGEIRFLQVELESMQGALEKHSSTPADQLDVQDKIWARDLRELSYDIEDTIDTFMVHGKSSEFTWPHSFKEFIGRSYELFSQFQVRRKIVTEIRDIKRRVIEVGERRERYKVNNDVHKPPAVDPRLLARYEKVANLVGMDKARDEVVKILMGGDETFKKQGDIVSIVGFGGLGKTTLANVVFEKIRAQFDCSVFVSVSRTPNMDRLFKDMLCQLSKTSNASTNVIDKLRQFLENRRYEHITLCIYTDKNLFVYRVFPFFFMKLAF
jgi:ATPase subunit of ABC transporter with duplicated ATPase domains